jgi:peptidoglycan/LPS O-acetylase OafA/YrhL
MRLAGVPDKWMYAATFARMDGLALGALVAIGLRSEDGRRILARVRVPLAIGAFTGLAAVMAYAHGLNRFEWVVQSIGYTLLAVIFALVVAEVAVPNPRGWKWLIANPLLRLVGKYSYAIYIFHVPVKFIVDRYAHDRFARFSDIHPLMDDVLFTASVGLISFALAALSFYLIEQPFLRLKDRLAPA